MLRKQGISASKRQMLKNLDALTYEKISEEYLKQTPSLERARKELQSEYIRNSQNKTYDIWCDLAQFRKYGPGLYLTFRFLKYLLLVMGCLLFLPLASMMICILEETSFVGKNMQTVLQSTTLSSLQGPQSFIVFLNFMVLFFLTASILYWQTLQAKLVLQCTEIKSLSSYYTVILTQIPNYYSQQDLKVYLEEQYGSVREIYSPKNFVEDLRHYREMSNLTNQYKIQRQIYLRNPNDTSCLKMVQIFMNLKQTHEDISHHIVANKIYEPYCAFVTFQSVNSKNRLLKDQGIMIDSCFSKMQTKNRQILYKGQSLHFRSCEMQPDGIIWQNLNVDLREKLLRRIIIAILLVVYLFVSITIFFVLSAADTSLYSDKYDYVPQEQILSSNNSRMIRKFCLQLGLSKFYSYRQCDPYRVAYWKHFVIYLAFPLVVILLKGLFAVIMKQLVKLRRHKYQFYQIKWEIIIITLFYFISTAFIKLFIYRSFQLGNIHIDLLTLFQPLLQQITKIVPCRPQYIHLYHDFDAQWVSHISHKTILIAMVSFNIPILFFHLSHYFGNLRKERRAKCKKTQREMNNQLLGYQFNIEFIYGECLALFLFAMLYFSCIPIIYPLVYLSLVLLYWVVKYKFIRLDRKPPVYSHSINQLAVKIVMLGLIVNSLISPLYYGGLSHGNHTSVFARWTTYWYYPLNAVIIIVGGFYRERTLKAYYSIKRFILIFLAKDYQGEYYTDPFDEMGAVKGELQSYSMHGSKGYGEVLKCMYALNRKEIHHLSYLPHKDIQSLKGIFQQQPNTFYLFNQLHSQLEIEIQRYKRDPQNQCRNIKECKQYLQIFREIKLQVQREIQEQQNCSNLYREVKDKIKGINKSLIMSEWSDKMRSISNKSQPQEAIDTIFQDQLYTGVRMNSHQ